MVNNIFAGNLVEQRKHINDFWVIYFAIVKLGKACISQISISKKKFFKLNTELNIELKIYSIVEKNKIVFDQY